MEKRKASKIKPLKTITYSVLAYQGYLDVMNYFNNYHEFEKLENMKFRLR